MLNCFHDAQGDREAQTHVQAQLEELFRSLMGLQTVLTHEFAGVFAKRDSVAERDPLGIAGLFLEIENKRFRQVGAEQYVAKVLDEIRVRIDVFAPAVIAFEPALSRLV